MGPSIVPVTFPRGSRTHTAVRCIPAGKRRCTVWINNEFLGHAIARVDGTWASKTPDEVTHPGRRDLAEALSGLLELRERVQRLIAESP